MRSISTFRSDAPVEIRCRYYDGKTSRANQAVMRFREDFCILDFDGGSREIPLAEISVTEPLGGAGRMIRFRDGGYCEAARPGDLRLVLAAVGYREPVTSAIQNSGKRITVLFFLLLGILAAGYFWALPFAAGIIAERIPRPVLSYISGKSVEALDGKWLFPSKLSEKKKRSLIKSFRKVRLPGGPQPIEVAFRSSELLGANAFALPDGTVLFMDRLVRIAKTRNELIAVYAHEADHVVHRHSIRQIIQNSVVAALVAVYIGDVSSIVGAVSGWILESKYSRDFERMADRYAAETLQLNDISPLTLGRALEAIEADHERLQGKGQEKELTDYISTHPPTGERIGELKAFMRERASGK